MRALGYLRRQRETIRPSPGQYPRLSRSTFNAKFSASCRSSPKDRSRCRPARHPVPGHPRARARLPSSSSQSQRLRIAATFYTSGWSWPFLHVPLTEPQIAPTRYALSPHSRQQP
jgi:hypothetical protein